MKEKFLHNEFWTLTFGAAFQRAYVYKKNVSDKNKEQFKTVTRHYIENELLAVYSYEHVSDEVHIDNIIKLSNFTGQFSNILQNGKLNFGVSQKMLNLYLKYLWCYGKISEPPHFPVDRRIQENIEFRPIVSWTRFKDEVDYMNIINHVRLINKEYPTIAEFELIHFKRRVKTKE
ncbi:hypothetical protein [Flavobacterium sp. GT3R68]|uniref:hypothetical protein n=1 Tax=Flavobacterium sp. GT3R68 TaxID=2594437 RepID=UPI000F87CF08|nr:hypothetical protein [Flavobacterium sp. GT3R68]RTY90613.1 hypothetical protein EKL32_20550 [Flavobacterium sp. GSN2]TRW89861.1 hypothetical protein FNW07_12515 [Flavobacterium sp. GT3R68]